MVHVKDLNSTYGDGYRQGLIDASVARLSSVKEPCKWCDVQLNGWEKTEYPPKKPKIKIKGHVLITYGLFRTKSEINYCPMCGRDIH